MTGTKCRPFTILLRACAFITQLWIHSRQKPPSPELGFWCAEQSAVWLLVTVKIPVLGARSQFLHRVGASGGQLHIHQKYIASPFMTLVDVSNSTGSSAHIVEGAAVSSQCLQSMFAGFRE